MTLIRLALILVLLLPSIADAQYFRVASLSHFGGVGTSYTVFNLDGTTDQVEWIVQAEQAEAITVACFRYSSRTGTPPAQIISIQGVDASGNPDGTIKGGGTPASATFTPPADTSWNNTGQCITLDNSYTPSRGELISFVIAYSSGTINTSNFSQYAITNQIIAQSHAFPYAISNNAGSRTRNSNFPIVWYRTATKTYGAPLVNVNLVQYSSDSTPDEYAIGCTGLLGDDLGYNVVGARVMIRTPAAAKSILIRLYDGTTVLQDWTLDSDVLQANNALPRSIEFFFDEVSLADIAAGDTIRLGFAPQETASNIAIYTADSLTGDPTAWSEPNCFLSTRTDSGAWSDDVNERPMVEFFVVPLAVSGNAASSVINIQ